MSADPQTPESPASTSLYSRPKTFVAAPLVPPERPRSACAAGRLPSSSVAAARAGWGEAGGGGLPATGCTRATSTPASKPSEGT